MLGNIKNKLGDAAVQKAIEKFAPQISAQLHKLTSMKVEDVRSDEKFRTLVVSPALLAAAAASSGATNLIPKFDLKFTNALFNVRNELVNLETDKIQLVAGFEQRLPDVLMQGFKE
jgi:hypothetical protein